MAERVFLHIGLPKTGTTYLQSVLWANKPALRERGVLVPGSRPRDHMRASIVVRQHPKLPGKSAAVRGSWDKLLRDIAGFEGTAVVSHEFFSVVGAEQARLAVSQLEADEVHVVVTARDLLRIVSSYWQEYLKHGFDKRLDHFPNPETPSWSEWGWSALDLTSVLERWGATVPPERLHVVVLPPSGSPPEELFTRFAGVVGFDSEGLDTSVARENASLPLVEAELLRRVTRELEGFTSALDRGVWLRHYLAHEKLVPRGGDRFLPSPERIAQLREISARAVTYIRAHDFDVVGDLEALLVPEELAARPAPRLGQRHRDAAGGHRHDQLDAPRRARLPTGTQCALARRGSPGARGGRSAARGAGARRRRRGGGHGPRVLSRARRSEPIRGNCEGSLASTPRLPVKTDDATRGPRQDRSRVFYWKLRQSFHLTGVQLC